MTQKFQFLCGNFENKKLIYATKFGKHRWHFFDEMHRIVIEHDSLPAKLEEIIATFVKVQSIEILLTIEQVKQYYHDGIFIFKNIELKTYIKLGTKSPVNRKTEHHDEITKNIVFMSGQTNPVGFLVQFEKCNDMKTDRDKLWRIRHFVDEEHKAEFSKLRFTGDWASAKKTFVEKYCLPFIENMKKEINIDFRHEPDLRSYVTQKFSGLSTYTSLTLINQMEIILNDLPEEVAYLFMVNEIFNCRKEDIFEFCDSVQDIVDMYNKDKKMQVDLLHCEHLNDSECSSSTSQEQSSTPRLGRGKRVSESKDSRPRKKNLTSIPEDQPYGDNTDFTFLNEISNSSKSTWSSCSESMSNWSSLD